MSPPTFITLPREIRDIVYQFVWDLDPANGPKSASPCRIHFLCKLCPSHRFPADITLALLHVNRQISAEAALVVFGKRTFCLDIKGVIPFLRGFSHRLDLIKNIEVEETSLNFLRTYGKTFTVLSAAGGPQSLTLSIDTLGARKRPFERALERLATLGIHHITDRMNVTVRFVGRIRLGYSEGFPSAIEFTDTWTYAQGERQWMKRGLHCRIYNGNIWPAGHERALGQPCDHEDHRRVFAGL